MLGDVIKATFARPIGKVFRPSTVGVDRAYVHHSTATSLSLHDESCLLGEDVRSSEVYVEDGVPSGDLRGEERTPCGYPSTVHQTVDPTKSLVSRCHSTLAVRLLAAVTLDRKGPTLVPAVASITKHPKEGKEEEGEGLSLSAGTRDDGVTWR